MNSEQTNELAAALCKAQAVMKPAVFDKINPHFKSKYASLAAVIDAIRKPLTDNGICWFHESHRDGSGWVLTTYLQHTSGQLRTSEHPLPDNVGPHVFSSAQTYGKRYNLTNLTGIAADEDDDANEAQKAALPTKPVVQAKPVDAGEPREIPLGDSPDGDAWARFCQTMIMLAGGPEWPDWDEANRANFGRMEKEKPKSYARLMAEIKKAQGWE